MIGTPKRPRQHPERDLERAATDLLGLDGWRSLKTDPVSDRARAKGFGEVGMADWLYIRYLSQYSPEWARHLIAKRRPTWMASTEVVWIEWKAPGGKATQHQLAWIAAERARGALVWLAGVDFPVTLEGFFQHYAASGLMRQKLSLGERTVGVAAR